MSIIIDKKFVTSSPHNLKADNSTKNIMLHVLIALIPVIISAVFFFGHLVVVNLVICLGACYGAELAYNLVVLGRKPTKQDVAKSSTKNLSCFVTGALLALNLPRVVDVWGWHWSNGSTIILSLDTIIICILASIFAIAVVKMLFGGLGRNFANPAVATRVFLLLSVTGGIVVGSNAIFGTNPLFGANTGFDATSGASWLGTSGENSINSTLSGMTFWNMFAGNVSAGAVGETSVLAIAIGYGYLVVKKIIDWRLPLILIGSVGLFALLFGLADNRLSLANDVQVGNVLLGYALAHILSGGLVFAAVFMATDYSTSPNSFWGNVVFCVGIALFTMVIRVYGQWPEGVSFAILLMNLCVPLIDRYIYPRPFGYAKRQKIAKISD